MKSSITILLLFVSVFATWSQRRITPVETPATMTQAVNETATDTARINERRRANSISYVDDRGLTIYVDTLTNTEWTDSTLIKDVKKLEYPRLHNLNIGVNVWDPMMRIFGQQYGLFDIWANVSLYNRLKPTVELGLGLARHTASDESFIYRSPLSFYFRLGADYNFLFNSDSDYQFVAGLRYGFSAFSYSIDDVGYENSYWGESGTFNVPPQHTTIGWAEFSLGLQVKLWGPISAGWRVRMRTILHQSEDKFGKPWYIPGYGTRGTPIAGSFSIIYTIPIAKKSIPLTEEELESGAKDPLAEPADIEIDNITNEPNTQEQ